MQKEDNARGTQKSNSQEVVNSSIHAPGYYHCAAHGTAYGQG